MKSSDKEDDSSEKEAYSSICTEDVLVEPPPDWELSCSASELFENDDPKPFSKEELRAALSAAIDVGNYRRAQELIKALEAGPRPKLANVIVLASRRVGDS